jgi:glutamate 5-kinase
MVTKVQAADLARRSGTSVVIASGGEPDILRRILQGERIGTRFTALEGALESRKRYILAGGAAGRLTADEGAAQALQRGGSLLPVGVTAVDGAFERGDTVMIVDAGGIEIARGIVNYRDVDLARIMRRKSDEIEGLLGFHYGDEVIHRSNLVLR